MSGQKFDESLSRFLAMIDSTCGLKCCQRPVFLQRFWSGLESPTAFTTRGLR